MMSSSAVPVTSVLSSVSTRMNAIGYPLPVGCELCKKTMAARRAATNESLCFPIPCFIFPFGLLRRRGGLAPAPPWFLRLDDERGLGRVPDQRRHSQAAQVDLEVV